MRRAPAESASSPRAHRERPALHALAAGAVIVAVALLAGCGSGGGSSSGGSSSTTAKGGSSSTTTKKKAAHPKPIGPPPMKETLAQAEKRITTTIASGDCKKINALNPVSLPQLANPARCKYLKSRLGGKKAGGKQSFKGLAGVIDYSTPNRNFTVVLIRDVDGLYHIAWVDSFHDSATVGTPFAPKFKQVAKQSFKALRDQNCDAYLKVAYARAGLGSHGKAKVCPHVKRNPIASVAPKAPKATPKLIGGNRFFAFYGLNGPTYLTMVLAREAPSQRPSGVPKGVLELPKGAPEYAFVRAYRTNEHKPPS